MARIRTFKPELWQHEQLGRLSALARLTFLGLIGEADDEGRGRGDPEYLWGRIHPYAPPGLKALWRRALCELKAVKDRTGPLVVFYKVGGATFYWLPAFNKQQKIDKPSNSKLPKPPHSSNGREESPLEGDQGSGIRDQGSGREEGATPPKASPSDRIAAAYIGKAPDVMRESKARAHASKYLARGGGERAALEAIERMSRPVPIWDVLDPLIPKKGTKSAEQSAAESRAIRDAQDRRRAEEERERTESDARIERARVILQAMPRGEREGLKRRAIDELGAGYKFLKSDQEREEAIERQMVVMIVEEGKFRGELRRAIEKAGGLPPCDECKNTGLVDLGEDREPRYRKCGCGRGK